MVKARQRRGDGKREGEEEYGYKSHAVMVGWGLNVNNSSFARRLSAIRIIAAKYYLNSARHCKYIP
ncbi:hypothetical protein VSX61_19100 [Brenneria populi subsp. brevivirga]|uniref:hypothetical protein n=1 Tax=Brenneria populi TaxID=1505588 RepID=UPI002E1775B5|nr:hypothetical protein [Brenneria populi subsp. brevivirga]